MLNRNNSKILFRTYATFMKQWPGCEVTAQVTSPSIDLDDYQNSSLTKTEIINTMVGDLQRIIEYPKLGYQIYQHVPKDVLVAFNIKQCGYVNHLMK